MGGAESGRGNRYRYGRGYRHGDAAPNAEYLAGTLRCEMENEISGIGKFIGEAGKVSRMYSYQ